MAKYLAHITYQKKTHTVEVDAANSTCAEVEALGLGCAHFDPHTQDSHMWDRIMDKLNVKIERARA